MIAMRIPVAVSERTPTASEPARATLARALRELEAAKGRVERDAEQAKSEMRAQLVAQLLPVLDDLDRTIATAEQGGDAPAVVEGVRLVRSQFERVLAGYGIERIDATHGRFDPARHEAVSIVPVTQPAAHGVVVQQLAPGYRHGERLLRPARVVVAHHTPPGY
jgi:molecular chaperone GrpE